MKAADKGQFVWGQEICRISLNFDGTGNNVMNIVKYHPWKSKDSYVRTGCPDLKVIEYNCEELRQSSNNIFRLVLAWIAYKHLGLNQQALVAGAYRALCTDD